MMYVIYNNDGSIKYKFLNEFVMQGNSYENVLFVAFENRSADTYTLYAEFKLPNGSTTTVASGSTPQTKNISGAGIYTGKCISLSNAETLVAGALQMNIKVITNDTEKVLVSFNTYITINETGTQPNDPVIITAEEYQNLLAMIGNQVANYQCILKGISLASFGDLEDYEVGQALYVVNNSEAKLYEINSSHEAVLVVDLLDKYSKSQIDSFLSGKVDKVNSANKIYATDNSGNQTSVGYGTNVIDGIVKRTGSQITLTFDPTENTHAANKHYVDTQINTYAAYYITRNAAGDAFATRSQLMSATTFYSGGVVRTPTRNDYCYVLADENHDNATTKYIYNNGWEFQIVINETAFTQTQLDAINSGANTTNIGAIANKVDKVNIASVVYATNGSAIQGYIAYTSDKTAYTIVYRDANGNTKVGTPVNNDDATPKTYVDSGLSTKLNISNVVSAYNSTSSNVYNVSYINDVVSQIQALASGRTSTFITKTSWTDTDIETIINNDGKVYFWYLDNWKVCDDTTYYDDFKNGKSWGTGSVLQSRANDVLISDLLTTNSSYWCIIDSKGDYYLITNADYENIIKANDNLMLLETDYADRWYFDGHLYALETAKLGWSAIGTTSDPAPKETTTRETSTTPSLALHSLTNIICSNALTSLTITSLVKDTNDGNPIWKIRFKTHASTPFTLTLPVGVNWANGTPAFYFDTEYGIVIEESVVSGNYLAYLL